MGFLDSLKKRFSHRDGDDRDSLAKKVKASPLDPQARQKLAAFLLKQGEVVDGLAELARAAELYEKGGFSGKAVAVLRQMLKYDSGNVDAERSLIRLLAHEGLTGDAQIELIKTASILARFAADDQKIEFYRQAAESLPKSPLPSLLAVDVLISQKKAHEAVTEMEKAARTSAAAGMLPDFSERMKALLHLAAADVGLLEPCGFLWLGAGMTDDALALLDRVVASARAAGEGPRLEEMEDVLAAIRQGRERDIAGAISFMDAARRLSAPAPEPAGETGDRPADGRGGSVSTPEEKQIVQSALERLQAKVQEEIGESDPEARYNLGIAYKEMGLLDEAAEEFRLSRRKPSLFLGASCLLAETLAEKGESDEALTVLDEVLVSGEAGETGSRDVRYQKALLLARDGREQESMEIFLRLFGEAPDYRDVRSRTESRRR